MKVNAYYRVLTSSQAADTASEQAAAATVFNETSHLSYPWENSSSGGGTSMPRSVPSQGLDASSWSVNWEDPVVRNLSSGASTFVNLSIEIPSNAAPGPYGFSNSFREMLQK